MRAALWQEMCVVAAAIAVLGSASAQSSRMSPEELNRMESYTHVPPDVKAFAAEYVAAWNAKEEGQLMALMVPRSRACITTEKWYYDGLLKARMRDPVPADYLLSLMPVNEDNVKALASQGYFLVKPERELHIDYEYPNTRDGGQLLVYLVHENGHWMADSPCSSAGDPGVSERRGGAGKVQAHRGGHSAAPARATAGDAREASAGRSGGSV